MQFININKCLLGNINIYIYININKYKLYMLFDSNCISNSIACCHLFCILITALGLTHD